MSSTVHKLNIRSFKGFKTPGENEKIVTLDFLNSAREVSAIFETFGKLFAPIPMDINNNIKVIEKVREQDPIANMYLEDMLVRDKVNKKSQFRLSVLWLKRALEMLLEVFINVVAEYKAGSTVDELKSAIKAAYEKTLLPFHGWMLQQTFSMMYRFSPKRSELFGKDADLEENIKALEDFIGPLQANVRQVHDFYTLHDLHCLKKV